ncbi:cysteine dioxygenase [Mycolicibacterium pulveris]|uniref:cysteine dioxygenase n=1 Tax=Mycolicibacterium pulveris TaxID=36813 RepID=UPI003CE7646A
MLTSAAPAVSAPTRLRLPDLLHATDRVADDVFSGRYDRLLQASGPPRHDRWFTRLHGDDELDIWLISWVPDRSTELHDHGGSLGALTVVSGALRETRWDGAVLRHRRLSAGDQAAFPLGWVHDVVRDASTHTLSVHAYSPPLTAMSYYDVTQRNTLRRRRTELTDGPEG